MTPTVLINRARPTLGPWLIVLIVAAASTGWWTYLTLRRADGLATAAFDQAYFQQLVWSMSVGQGLRSSFNPGDFLGLHLSPLLAIPAALQGLWPDARLLTVMQSIALGAALPAAFLFIRTLLRPARSAAWVAAALVLPLAIWPITQQQVRADFHTEVLALPAVFIAGWAGLSRRHGLMLGAALAALLAREDQVYPVAIMGLVIAAHGRGRLTGPARPGGLALIGLAVTWAVLAFGVVKPALRAGATYDTDGYYAWLGGGLGVLRLPFERTQELIMALTQPIGWSMVGWSVVALGGLALLRPRWLVLVLPPVVAHFLSRQPPQAQIGLQYGLLLVVPLVVASGLGARRLLALVARFGRRRRGLARSRAIPTILGIGLVVSGIVAAFGRGAVPPFSGQEPAFWNRPAAITTVRAIARQVPPDVPLAVDWGLASAVASRRHLQVFPAISADAFVLVDGRPYVSGRLRWVDRASFLAELASSGRMLLVDDGRFQLWGPLP